MASGRSQLWTTGTSCVLVAVMLSNSIAITAANRENCESRMHNCTERVRPFLHDLEYMFPTNLQHIDNMCRMWSSFVDCIRLFVKDCATDEQRSRFNDAVGDSIDTVHAICSSEKYQKEYLQSASCFRKVSVDNCGTHYNDMIDEVSRSATESSDSICCSYSKFRSCVSEPLLRLCGSRARTIMDHSMTFLIHRCSSESYSLSYECPKSRGRSAFTNDRPIVVSSSAIGDTAAVPDVQRNNNDIRQRHSSFRYEQDDPRHDFHNRPYSNSRQFQAAGRPASPADPYRPLNTYRYNDHSPTDLYRASPTFAASPTFTASSSGPDYSPNDDGSRKLQGASARAQGRPVESTSSRLLRNFNENEASAGHLAVGTDRFALTLASLLVLLASSSRYQV